MADSLHAALMLAHSDTRRTDDDHHAGPPVAIHGIPVSLLLRFLPHIDFSDEDLGHPPARFEAIEFREQLWRATCGERVLCWSLFEQVSGAPVADLTAARLSCQRRRWTRQLMLP